MIQKCKKKKKVSDVSTAPAREYMPNKHLITFFICSLQQTHDSSANSILKCRNKFVVRFRNSFLYEEAELGFLALLKTDAKVPSAPSVVSPVCLSTTEYQNLLPSSCLKNMLPLQMSNQVEQVYQGHI